MKRSLIAFSVVTLAAGLANAVAAQQPVEMAKGPPADRDPVVSVTRHSGTFGGQRISYTATAGETFLRGENGTPRAAIFSTAYVREPRDPNRPVTFLFNGGPGSGSVWLHMGAFGPRRVAIPSNGTDDGAPPYPIVDNPDSLLDVTDIVFIDPVGTGFSHALGETNPQDYYGVTRDAQSVAQFIRHWLNENGRWNSPKYLGGESYGTTRTAAVLNQLEGAFNDVALNGIILISTVLDFGAGADTPGNEMTHILNLPSMAATALYHGKAEAASVEQFTEEARRFAIGPYAHALLQGSALPAGNVRRSGESWRDSPACPSNISIRPTFGSVLPASTRSFCATGASPSADSIPAIPAATMTMPGKVPTTIRAFTESTPAIRPRSTSISGRLSASGPTAPT